jgi:AcrR family transcriptional regulator
VTRTAGNADPTPPERRARKEFPPTARKLLVAARRVLVRKGYPELTMQAIEQESGINRALVHYYFGSKAGLVEALVDTLFEDAAFGYSDAVTRTPAGPDRVSALLDWLGRITADERTGRLLYELLPHIVRSRKLRSRAAELYGAYREFDGEVLAPRASADVREDLGALNVAMVDGLQIQSAIDPSSFDLDRALLLWENVLIHYLDNLVPDEEES